MSDVVLPSSAFDKHVIYINFHALAYMIFEYFVDKPLVGGTCIL